MVMRQSKGFAVSICTVSLMEPESRGRVDSAFSFLPGSECFRAKKRKRGRQECNRCKNIPPASLHAP